MSYVTIFYPHNPEIYAEIQNNKSPLLRDDRLQTIFKNKAFLKSKTPTTKLEEATNKSKIF